MTVVKRITVEDNLQDTVHSIWSNTWSDKSEIHPDDYSVEKLKVCLEQENHIFCVAHFENQFAGMASAFFMKKPDGSYWLYVDEVDVCADKQQKGVGTALMEFLFAEGKKRQCDEVWLGTEKDNVSANALYQSLGPSEVEDFIGYTYKFKS